MKQSEIARALGITRSAICKCVALGCPTDSVEAAAAWRDSHLDPSWSTPTPTTKRAPMVANLAAQRARLAEAQAERLERLNARDRGELLERRVVLASWQKRISAFRTRILCVPSRCARFAPPGQYTKFYDELERELHDALRELAGNGDVV